MKIIFRSKANPNRHTYEYVPVQRATSKCQVYMWKTLTTGWTRWRLADRGKEQKKG